MFTHINKENKPTMVDVGDKKITKRRALARSVVVAHAVLMQHFKDGDISTKKGPVFQTAIIAGNMAVKKTFDLIPFCHPVPIEACNINIDVVDNKIVINCEVKAEYKTGIEMEALCGASVAALTVYDMCKALSHEIIIEKTELISKNGGKKDYVKT